MGFVTNLALDDFEGSLAKALRGGARRFVPEAACFLSTVEMLGRVAEMSSGIERVVGGVVYSEERASGFLQQLAHESKRSTLVALGLDEKVEDFVVLVDGTPQIHSLSAYRGEYLIEMPERMSRAPLLAQAVRDPWAELGNPATDGLTGDHDPALREQVFDISRTQGETGVEPDRMLDDRWREVAVTVADRFHRPTLPGKPPSCDKAMLAPPFRAHPECNVTSTRSADQVTRGVHTTTLIVSKFDLEEAIDDALF